MNCSYSSLKKRKERHTGGGGAKKKERMHCLSLNVENGKLENCCCFKRLRKPSVVG